MADITKIVLPNGNEYNFKDSGAARSNLGISGAAVGEAVVVASVDAQGHPTSYDTINVIVPLSIAVTTQPTKTSYEVGDSFDPTGMVVTLTMSDGSTRTVDNSDLTFSPATFTAENAQTIVTVTYHSGYYTLTTTLTVTVNEATAGGIYGVSWDGTSTTSWTRTDDAALFTDPVPYVLNATNYGSPFDTISPWQDMTIVEDAEAGMMVKIPKFWYLLEQDGAGMNIKISPTEQTGYAVCPACMDRGDGHGERDYVLVGRYHCGDGSNSTTAYKSVTGVLPKTTITRPAARTAIHELGTNVWQWDWATRFTIWLLYLVEYANWNSQATLGYGCGNDSSPQAVGASDSMPYHTGTMRANKTTYGVGVQYRHIEGLWDNVRDWLDGCYNASSGLNIILNPANFSDSTGGVSVGTPSFGFPSAFTVHNESGTYPVFIPSEANGSDLTYSADEWRFNQHSPCVLCGGSYSRDYLNGLFCFFCFGVGEAFGSISSRSIKL